MLFFTSGVSLRIWYRSGMFAREVGHYSRLQDKVCDVTFVSYGDIRERWYRRKPGGDSRIGLITNALRLPLCLFARLLPLLHGWRLREADIIKCNQVQGGDLALAMARRFGKPFIARCGYLHSDFIARQQGLDSDAARQARAQEMALFTGADHCIVTTPAMAKVLTQGYGVAPQKVTVIGNFVETGIFRSAAQAPDIRILFVGRFNAQKNLALLIRAAAAAGIGVTLVGEGQERDALAALATETGADVRFAGRVANRELPEVMRRHAIFVLPSHYEGHPKALLEAMACGMAVIGTDVPGIQDQIRDGETGLLVAPTAGALEAALRRLAADASLRTTLGAHAAAEIAATLSPQRAVDTEAAIIAQLTGRPALS
jgi:glycosyltransferase involved in cell wall biosynthesis